MNQCNFFTKLMKLYKDKTALDFLKKDKMQVCKAIHSKSAIKSSQYFDANKSFIKSLTI